MVTHRTEHVVMASGRHVAVSVSALARFEGDLRDQILALKYHGRLDLARSLGRDMATLLVMPCDVVTWAPTSDVRRSMRGFDQAELLARHLASVRGVRWLRLLRRIDDAGQTGRDRAGRLGAPIFVAKGRTRGLRVVLVDDVVTTGATLRAAVTALSEAGAREVQALCAATVDP